MQELVRLGFMQFDATASPLVFTSFKLARDSVLLSLPVAAGLPNVFIYLAAAGVVAASLVAATAATVSLANVLTEDVINGLSWEPMPKNPRLLVARISIAAVAVLGGAFTLLAPTDPLRLLLWSFAIIGSTFFPVLAGIVGLPASAVGALLVSLATPGPTRSMLELVREIRIPGGEVVYDREMRLLRLKNRERSQA
jgi:cation/acetate symporter